MSLYLHVKEDLFSITSFVVTCRYAFSPLLDAADEEEEENLISDAFGKTVMCGKLEERGEIIIHLIIKMKWKFNYGQEW